VHQSHLRSQPQQVSALMALHGIGQQAVIEARRKSNGPI